MEHDIRHVCDCMHAVKCDLYKLYSIVFVHVSEVILGSVCDFKREFEQAQGMAARGR